jgi:hypothetical protein
MLVVCVMLFVTVTVWDVVITFVFVTVAVVVTGSALQPLIIKTTATTKENTIALFLNTL